MKCSRKASVSAAVLMLVVLAAAISPAMAAPRGETAVASVTCRALAHPVLKYPYLFAIGKFQCATGAHNAKATLVLQGFEHGTWAKVQSATEEVNARAGKKYVLRTPRMHCSSTPHKLRVRTLFDLEAGPLKLQLPPSEPFPTFCI